MSKFNGHVTISKDLYYRLMINDFKLELFDSADVIDENSIDDESYWEKLEKFEQKLYKELDNSASLIYK